MNRTAKSLSAVAASTALAVPLIGLTGPAAHAASGPTFGTVTISGAGCPNGTYQTFSSSDRHTLTVSLSKFAVQSGQTLSCTVTSTIDNDLLGGVRELAMLHGYADVTADAATAHLTYTADGLMPSSSTTSFKSATYNAGSDYSKTLVVESSLPLANVEMNTTVQISVPSYSKGSQVTLDDMDLALFSAP